MSKRDELAADLAWLEGELSRRIIRAAALNGIDVEDVRPGYLSEETRSLQSIYRTLDDLRQAEEAEDRQLVQRTATGS